MTYFQFSSDNFPTENSEERVLLQLVWMKNKSVQWAWFPALKPQWKRFHAPDPLVCSGKICEDWAPFWICPFSASLNSLSIHLLVYFPKPIFWSKTQVDVTLNKSAWFPILKPQKNTSFPFQASVGLLSQTLFWSKTQIAITLLPFIDSLFVSLLFTKRRKNRASSGSPLRMSKTMMRMLTMVTEMAEVEVG